MKQMKPNKTSSTGRALIDCDLMRQQRDALGWTQDDLASKAGYGKRAIQKIEQTGHARYQTAANINKAMRRAFEENPELRGAGRKYQDIRKGNAPGSDGLTEVAPHESQIVPSSVAQPAVGPLSTPLATPLKTQSERRATKQTQASVGRFSPENVSAVRDRQSVLSFPATTLFTKMDTPQWADYRDIDLKGGRVRSLSCRIRTGSQYFRFGFKLRTPSSRLFGDGSIQSCADANIVVHIGRDKLTRDLFFTSYWNGIRERPNKLLHAVPDVLSALFSITVDDLWMLSVSIDGGMVYQRSLAPELASSVVMLAWGDHDEYAIDVLDFVATVTCP